MIRSFWPLICPTFSAPRSPWCRGSSRRAQAEVRRVPLGNIHLTLKFFGKRTDAEVSPSCRRPGVAAEATALDLQGDRAGAFLHPQPPGGLGGPRRGRAPSEPIVLPAGKGLRPIELPAGGPGLQPAPDPRPGALPEGRAQLSRSLGKTGGGLAAVYGAGDHLVSERAVPQRVDLYADGGNSVRKAVGR